MALHRPENLKAFAINIALAFIIIGSLAFIVQAQLTGARTDAMIEQAKEAYAAGSFADFESYRESGRILMQITQEQQHWLYMAYIAVGLAVVAVLACRTTKI